KIDQHLYLHSGSFFDLIWIFFPHQITPLRSMDPGYITLVVRHLDMELPWKNICRPVVVVQPVIHLPGFTGFYIWKGLRLPVDYDPGSDQWYSSGRKAGMARYYLFVWYMQCFLRFFGNDPVLFKFKTRVQSPHRIAVLRKPFDDPGRFTSACCISRCELCQKIQAKDPGS